MSQGAAIFLEREKLEREKQDKPENKVEIRIEHVPARESPEVPQQESAFTGGALEISGRSIPSLIDHLVLRMQEVGEQYANNIQDATKQLLARVEATAKPGQSANHPAARHKIAAARDEFAGKVLEAAGLLDTQRQMIIEEAQALNRQNASRIQEKIAQTETEVEHEEVRIQQMVEGVTMDIPALMRANAAQNERKAYLEGLKFRGDV